MRLFIAIEFPEALKDELSLLTERLCALSESGNFTRRENFHLTLSFLGETERVSDIRSAIDRSGGDPFGLETARFGRFCRPGGDIWWLGLQPSAPLAILQKRLTAELRQEGFELEEREFNPHLTIGRKVVFSSGTDRTVLHWDIPPLLIPGDRISLMKSERIGGRLIYTSLYRKALSKKQI